MASALFVVVSGALFFTLRAGRLNQETSETQSESLRACLLAVEHLRSELGAALVEAPLAGETASELSYRVPQRDADNRALLGPTGDVAWGPLRSMALMSGKLVRTEDTDQRILSNLGNNPTVEFNRVSPTLLEVTITSDIGTGFTLTRSFRLKNQF